jgi:hypothetical protein
MKSLLRENNFEIKDMSILSEKGKRIIFGGIVEGMRSMESKSI